MCVREREREKFIFRCVCLWKKKGFVCGEEEGLRGRRRAQRAR